MKAAVRRIRALEIRFGPSVEAVPSATEAIVERLLSSEWEFAM